MDKDIIRELECAIKAIKQNDHDVAEFALREAFSLLNVNNSVNFEDWPRLSLVDLTNIKTH